MKTDIYKSQLQHLLQLPKIEQRTPEWYEARQTLITASDFAQALGEGKFGTQKQLIQKKCGFEQDKFDNSAAALRWGTMFEDVACAIYAQRNETKIHNFGLLRHPNINYFGASPDGITEDGIMVEIKCPWKRKIDGNVPLQYFYQIQGQLDVCGLSECDYWECEFIDSENACDTQIAGTFEKGVILEKENNVYIYSPSACNYTEADLEAWTAAHTSSDVIKVHYYALTKCSCIRVYKDDDFLKDRLEKLGDVWNKIKEYRADENLYNMEIKSTSDKPSPYKLTGYAFLNI
jgi:putative phage-type endonuclease